MVAYLYVPLTIKKHEEPGDVIVIIDEHGITRYKSENLEKLFGWKPEEVVGERILAHVHPDDLNDAQAFIAGLLKTPEATADIELRYRDKDGDYKWISLTASNLLHDPDIKGIIGNYSDITDMKEAQKKLEAFAAVIENSDNIVVVKDLDLRVIATNRAFANAAGYDSVKSLLGKTDAEIFGVSLDVEPVRSYMEDERQAQTLPRGQYILKEEEVVCADGTVKTVMTKKYPVYDSSGKLVGTGNISTDITVRKQAEKALRESEEKFRQITDSMGEVFWLQSAADFR
jgi:PAS domain S-box-containing protein